MCVVWGGEGGWGLTDNKLVRADHAYIVGVADMLAACALVEQAADAHGHRSS